MNKILTVIVPMYNMEQYIEECLNSLVVDNAEKLLEVIVVNDGSTDNSSRLAHSFSDKHPNIFKVIDKANGHYGSCINTGLAAASGKYVKVLDADDFFNSADFNDYLQLLTTCDADMVITDWAKTTIKGKPYRFRRYPEFYGKTFRIEELSPIDTFRCILMHAITYRTEMLHNIGYHQPEGVCYSDDVWRFTPLTAVKTVVFYPKLIYCYRLGREGQSMDLSVMMRNAKHYLVVANHKLDIWEQVKDKVSPEVYALMENQIIYNEGFTLKFGLVYNSIPNDTLIQLDDRVKTLCPEIYDDVAHCSKFTFSFYNYIAEWRKNRSGYHFPKRWKLLVDINDFILVMTEKYKYLFH